MVWGVYTDTEANNFRNEERVSVMEAIDMYTRGGAFAAMQVIVLASSGKPSLYNIQYNAVMTQVFLPFDIWVTHQLKNCQ